ncbi:hypothetical protein JYP49_21510 [Nitratireductor aquimarinus]|uniref:DUF6963 family protein n=1 Tax=Nitratireductor TaxID=245876 RepID=UPI0019D3BBE5|nr:MULTISPECIES: hypothetical protein [Nitratireductor]MBN7778828.1 hypothetical protein [Nitratireductor pacificus]MBN7783151.1 hypothetical protein [Nitratireductor pacificus]MBN7791976.1 hypothetical protein [Nitratireductor aquimarinus]MBY6101216.1 hypothetical protein [Nitratireductor aquimarinus]MCA1261703.1 hypothetical protein [Nitratireductor aquimarinus]
MTIGIAAYGEGSLAAVQAAVSAAELLGRGAIGGFAVLAVIEANGEIAYRTTQRGGISALDIPVDWFQAQYAAVISSGPDRPDPITQFLAGKAGVGLVTGHRLPNSPTADGVSANIAVLDRMAVGEAPQDCIDAVLAQDPEMDAGLIAVALGGRLGISNASRVLRRGDLGQAHLEEGGRGFALLLNSIFAATGECQTLADVVGGLAWQELTGKQADHMKLTLEAPVLIKPALVDRVYVDMSGRIVALETSDPRVCKADRLGTAAYLSTEVWLEERPLGIAVSELVARLANGLAHPHGLPIHRSMMMRRSHVTA